MSDKEKMYIVTEVGCFGDLNLQDPTVQKTKNKESKEQSIKDMIEESINTNRDNFIKD